MVTGELFLMIGLQVLMLQLYVDNLDITRTVSFSIHNILSLIFSLC